VRGVILFEGKVKVFCFGPAVDSVHPWGFQSCGLLEVRGYVWQFREVDWELAFRGAGVVVMRVHLGFEEVLHLFLSFEFLFQHLLDFIFLHSGAVALTNRHRRGLGGLGSDG